MNKRERIQDIEDEMICCPDDEPCGSWLCQLGRDFIDIIEQRYNDDGTRKESL